ncbi:MAG: hypothetical protein GY822_05135 [Deltaproteobacteria bacterium]|nr:hypothetical protein [Deltaproteobacteria bacterium]
MRLLVASIFGVVFFTMGCATGEPGPSVEPAAEPEDPAVLEWLAEAGDDVDHHPQLRWGFVVADRGDGTSLVFGGSERGEFSGGLMDDLWSVDANTSPAAFTKLDATGPQARYCGCAAYDTMREQALVVGGWANFSEQGAPIMFAETWRYDESTKQYTEITASTSPDSAYGCSMVYVPGDDVFILFGGGKESGARSDETWRFTPSTQTWDQLDTGALAPSGRYDAGMVFIPGSRELLLFAGFDIDLQGDLWRFDLDNNVWREVELDGDAPAARRVPWMRAAADGSEVVFGFGAAGDVAVLDQPHQDLWSYSPSDDVISTLSPAGDVPAARGYTMALPGGEGEVGLLLGGFDGFNPVGNYFRLQAPEDSGF